VRLVTATVRGAEPRAVDLSDSARAKPTPELPIGRGRVLPRLVRRKPCDRRHGAGRVPACGFDGGGVGCPFGFVAFDGGAVAVTLELVDLGVDGSQLDETHVTVALQNPVRSR